MSLDDGYIYPTIISITSILENANPNIKYDFYILCSPNLSVNNKKVKSLEKCFN